ncbi:MAG: molybdopterin molybdotransferase MoeA [Caulobacteraceae bacterium]|nr:molybdopterin molybdotransferase MoeA [Caulobacteraceae bacterium]
MKDLPVEEARARMLAGIEAPAAESVELAQAIGRVLAEPVTAVRAQPPFDASAMDGWAVSGPGERFEIMGESAAGQGYGRRLEPGQAVRIFTGAPVPPGATRVVLQEVAERQDGWVRTPPADHAPTHVRPAGGDFKAGDVLLEAGLRLDPWRLSLAAAAGRASLAVAARPKVTLLSTGEEIVPVGGAPAGDQIFDSGGPTLAALITGWGGQVRHLASVGDDADAIAGALDGAGGALIVTLGGASVGDHDLVKPALARLGLQLAVETIRIRPGKPTWFGRLTDGRRVLGLPGNPASAMVCAELFLRPLLNALQGAEPGPATLTARLGAPAGANGPREHWARARTEVRDGVIHAVAFSDQDSSLVSVFAKADALMRRAAGAPAAAAGERVDILPLERL